MIEFILGIIVGRLLLKKKKPAVCYKPVPTYHHELCSQPRNIQEWHANSAAILAEHALFERYREMELAATGKGHLVLHDKNSLKKSLT